MLCKADILLLSFSAVWLLFAHIKGSVVTFNTQEGCNATLLCHQTGNVTWIHSDSSQIIATGARFHPSAFGLFSTLLITDVSKNDKGNIICVGKERNITINLEVCHDVSRHCAGSLAQCPDPWVRDNCRKSCGFCPKPNCTETVLPIIPTTGNPQATPVGRDSSTVQSTTELTVTMTPTRDQGVGNKTNGASSRSALQCLFFLSYTLFLCSLSFR